ncbi:hypothetical protein [Streptomyces antarcticus]|uniref:aspartate-alanine antiporter-like transporter n=1 Tax=Streptomyces antarcticus TaxID=2996458 RepID=UPI003B8362B7
MALPGVGVLVHRLQVGGEHGALLREVLAHEAGEHPREHQRGQDALVVCVTGLGAAWLFASLAGYGPGLSAGLLGGGLTQSAVIGVGADAIAHLPGLSPAEAKDESHLVAVAYAVTYPLGTRNTWGRPSLRRARKNCGPTS